MNGTDKTCFEKIIDEFVFVCSHTTVFEWL